MLYQFLFQVLEGTDIHPLYLLALNSRIAAILLFPVWCFRDGLLLWRGVESGVCNFSFVFIYPIFFLVFVFYIISISCAISLASHTFSIDNSFNHIITSHEICSILYYRLERFLFSSLWTFLGVLLIYT